MYLWIQNQKSTQNALKRILSQNLAQDHVEVWNGVIGVERVLKNKSEYNFFLLVELQFLMLEARHK